MRTKYKLKNKDIIHKYLHHNSASSVQVKKSRLSAICQAY